MRSEEPFSGRGARRGSRVRLAGAALALGVVGVLQCSGPASACIGIPVVTVSPNPAPPGATITALIPPFSGGSPPPGIAFHLDTPDGPLLAAGTSTPAGAVTADFTLPEDQLARRAVVIVATKDSGNAVCGLPARALLQLGSAETSHGDVNAEPLRMSGLHTVSRFELGTAVSVAAVVASIGLLGVVVATGRAARSTRARR